MLHQPGVLYELVISRDCEYLISEGWVSTVGKQDAHTVSHPPDGRHMEGCGAILQTKCNNAAPFILVLR